MAKNLVVIGTQWGDEGKGKIVDWLTDHAEGVVRFQGGHNAGHTLVIGQGSNQKEYKLIGVFSIVNLVASDSLPSFNFFNTFWSNVVCFMVFNFDYSKKIKKKNNLPNI